MHATASLIAALSVVVLSQATPFYYPQQRQLFYPVVPQYPSYYPRQVYYAPPAAANLISPVAPAFRYPVLAAPEKSVVYYGAPAVAPYPGNFLYPGGADGTDEGGLYNTLSNYLNQFWGGENSGTVGASEVGGNAPVPEAPVEAGPEKIEQATSGEQPAKEAEGGQEKGGEAEKPAKAQKVALKGGPQKFVVVGQPQFFGNFAPQRVNPAAVLPTADHGAVSSYLLLKNYPGYRFGPQVPVVPQLPQVGQVPQAPQVPQAADTADAELIPAGQPGAAALGYQKLLKEAAAEAARQSKEYDDTASVSVDAAAPQEDKPEAAAGAEEGDADKNEEEETGTSE